MSYLIAAPELMTSAATDLATVGENVNAAHMVAAARTTAVIPAAADEVSTGIAQLFSRHAASYQATAAQAAAFNDQFVQHLTAGAFSYTNIEATLASLLQDLTANANGFVSFIASTPPQQLLIGALLLLTSPIWAPVVVPVLGIGLLVFLYLLSKATITIMPGVPLIFVNGMGVI